MRCCCNKTTVCLYSLATPLPTPPPATEAKKNPLPPGANRIYGRGSLQPIALLALGTTMSACRERIVGQILLAYASYVRLLAVHASP
jgi:hypothetical protein